MPTCLSSMPLREQELEPRDSQVLRPIIAFDPFLTGGGHVRTEGNAAMARHVFYFPVVAREVNRLAGGIASRRAKRPRSKQTGHAGSSNPTGNQRTPEFSKPQDQALIVKRRSTRHWSSSSAGWNLDYIVAASRFSRCSQKVRSYFSSYRWSTRGKPD